MRLLKALTALLLLSGPAAASTPERTGPCPPRSAGSTAGGLPSSSAGAVVITEDGGVPAGPQQSRDCVYRQSPGPAFAPAGMPQPSPPDPLAVAPSASSLHAASYNPGRPAPANLTEGQRVIHREYDDFDRITSETVDLEDGGQATVAYSYWRNGLRKTVTDASGRVTFYEYNDRNLLSRVTVNQALPDEQTTTYEYWPDNLLKTIRRPNGTATGYTYDHADRVLTIVVAKGTIRLAAYEYGYDANGNRISQVEENGGPPETTLYEYDGLNRLRAVTYPGGKSVTYGYDAVGNRVSETERDAGGTVVSDKVAVFDAANRLSTVTDSVDPAGTATFTYDRNGNLLTKTTAAGTQQHMYDVRDVLVETREGEAITARFAWDALGRRYLKIGAEGVRQYLYDQTSLLQELDENGQEVAKYEYGADHLASFFRRDEPRRYFHLDALGSVTSLSDAGGDMLARYHLDAWGNLRFPSELDASKNRFGFTGYLWDGETDLYFAKARFYDPAVGRFTSQDSYLGQIDDPPSLHRYFYAKANPGRYVDPTGHQTAVATGYEWIYRNPLERLAKKIEQAEQKAKTFLGEVGMGISTGAANVLKAVNSPGHMPPEKAREYYLQPQTTTEKVFAEGTEIALTVAPLAAKGVPSRAGARPARERTAPLTGTIVESAPGATGESVVGQGQTILQTDSGGLFVTGEQGQALYARGRLGLKPAERNPTAQAELAGKQAGDHAGHMLGARFGFEGEGYNLTPMAGSEVNLGSFKRMENFWAKLRKQGHEVDAEVFAVHRSDPLRPDKIVVSYTVDNGTPVTVVLDNPLPAAKTPKASTP